MIVERLSCLVSSPRDSSRFDEGDNEDDDGADDNEEPVRAFVNDAGQPLLHFLGVDDDGMCELAEFVRSQEYTRDDGFSDFAAAFFIPERTNKTYPSGTAIITLRGLTVSGLDHDSNAAIGERARGTYSGPRKRWVLFKVNSWHLIMPTFSKCPTNTNSRLRQL
jgi:hypothetical protein